MFFVGLLTIKPVLLERLAAAGILRAGRLHTLISQRSTREDSKSKRSGQYDWDIAAPATPLRPNAAAPKSVGLQGAGAANPNPQHTQH